MRIWLVRSSGCCCRFLYDSIMKAVTTAENRPAYNVLVWNGERCNVQTHEDQKGIYILLVIHNSSLVDLTNQIIHSGPSGTFWLDSNTVNVVICVIGTILVEKKLSDEH